MAPRSTTALGLVAVAAIASLSAKVGQAHPLCYLDDSTPSLEITATYCANEEPDGFCCAEDVESELEATLGTSGASGTCAELYKEVLCGVCHPYSAHLYERLNVADGLTMTIDFCSEFYTECSEQLGLAEDYCEVHTGGGETDQYWSYPLVIDGEYED